MTRKKECMTPDAKLSAFGSIRSSFDSLQLTAARRGDFEMAKVIGGASQLASMASSMEILKAGLGTPGASLTTFAGSLGLMAGTLSIVTTLFGSVEGDNALGQALHAIYGAIVKGFTQVLGRIDALKDHIDRRLDHLEAIMDQHHYTLIRGFVEVIRREDSLKAHLLDLDQRQQKQSQVLGQRICHVGDSLEKAMSLMHSNLSAFRHEGLADLMTRIQYYVSNDLMSEDKIHGFLADLQGAYRRLVTNPHLTHATFHRSSLQGLNELMESEESLSLIGVLVPKADASKMVHLAINRAILTFWNDLTAMLTRSFPAHVRFAEEAQRDFDFTLDTLNPAISHFLPNSVAMEEAFKVAKAEDLASFRALAEQEFAMDLTSIKSHLSHLAKDLDLFGYFTKETAYLRNGRWAQSSSSSGKPMACVCRPRNWAKMVIVDEHHKKWTRDGDGRSYGYGLICGGSYGRNACRGSHLSLYEECPFEGCDKVADVIPFLSSIDSTTDDWVAREAREAIQTALDAPSTPQDFISVVLTIEGEIFNLTYPLESPSVMRDSVTEAFAHGFYPRLHLTMDGRSVSAKMVLTNCGFPDKPFFSTEDITLSDDTSEVFNRKEYPLKPYEKFIWLALVDRPRLIGSFGFTFLNWNHGNSRSPSSPCRFHLPLSHTSWNFESIMSVSIRRLSTSFSLLVRHHAETQVAKCRERFERTPVFEDFRLQKAIFAKAQEHLGKIFTFVSSLS